MTTPSCRLVVTLLYGTQIFPTQYALTARKSSLIALSSTPNGISLVEQLAMLTRPHKIRLAHVHTFWSAIIAALQSIRLSLSTTAKSSRYSDPHLSMYNAPYLSSWPYSCRVASLGSNYLMCPVRTSIVCTRPERATC